MHFSKMHFRKFCKFLAGSFSAVQVTARVPRRAPVLVPNSSNDCSVYALKFPEFSESPEFPEFEFDRISGISGISEIFKFPKLNFLEISESSKFAEISEISGISGTLEFPEF